MLWVIAALASAVLLGAQAIGLRAMSIKYRVPNYMGFVWMIAGVTILMGGVATQTIAVGSDPWLILLAGAASWAGMCTYNLALREAPNPGLPDAAASARTPLVYMMGLGLGAGFQAWQLVGVGLSVLSLMALSLSGTRSSSPTRSRRPNWLPWALTSALAFAMFIVLCVGSAARGTSVPLATGCALALGGLIFILQALLGSTGGLSEVVKDGRLYLTASAAALGNFLLIYASAEAPNPGYATAISSVRPAVLYAAWVIAGRSKPTLRGVLAVVGMALAVTLVST